MSERPTCACGCGRQVNLMPYNVASRGWVKGRPFRFVQGHNSLHGTEAGWQLEDRGFRTLCWIWQGGVTAPNGDGYARAMRRGRLVQLHRWNYEQIHGPVAKDLFMDHLCEQKPCVNPDHVEPVTPAENVRRSRRCTLTPTQVEEIRAAMRAAERTDMRRPRGTIPPLAEKYGVDEKTIKNIGAARTWA